VEIRTARPAEVDAIGELTVAAYRSVPGVVAMHAAQRLYRRLGFRRSPERGWPVPDSELTLVAYVLTLDGIAA
jgi:hypothetical protein